MGRIRQREREIHKREVLLESLVVCVKWSPSPPIYRQGVALL
jgi:hypothetical protein